MPTSQNRHFLTPVKPGQGSLVFQGNNRAPLGEISTNTNLLTRRFSSNQDLPEESSGESSPYYFGNDTIDSSPVLNENVSVGNYHIFEYDNNVSSPILDESSDVDESLALSEEELECNETYIRPQISDDYEDEEHESVVERLPLPKPWTDCFDEYTYQIITNAKKVEHQYLPMRDYMRRQQEVTYEMRSILVNWLVDVADEYKLQTQTIFLAVNFIDRFLSVKAVPKKKFQLVGTTCMWIAS